MYQLSDLNKATSGDDASQDDGKTETTDALTAQTTDSYGSFNGQAKSTGNSYVPKCGLIFYIMAFLGFVTTMLLRETLSVAIVDMVNQTTVTEADIAMTNDTDQDECPRDPELENEGGELNWDRIQQAVVLSAFYYGYGITQIPGGLAADHFGGTWLFGGCLLLSSVITLLTPGAARESIALLTTLRFLSGLGEGVMLPASNALIARWSVPLHRTRVVNMIFVGSDVGIIIGLSVTGVLCDYVSWQSAFYFFGLIGCLYSISWFFLCYDSPPMHPRISTAELEYWEQMIGIEDLTVRPPTPWQKILTSVPVWALAVASFADSWGYFTLVTCLPLYMHDVLGLNMSKNGLFSAIPYLASVITIPLYGMLADWLRAPGRLSTTVVRKAFCVVGCVSSGCILVTLGLTGCNRALAITILLVFEACESIVFTTVSVNSLDLAPLHAGRIMGLIFTVGNLAAIIGPLIVGALTYERSTHKEWQKVFVLTAIINGIGAIVYLIFGSGERQSWAE